MSLIKWIPIKMYFKRVVELFICFLLPKSRSHAILESQRIIVLDRHSPIVRDVYTTWAKLIGKWPCFVKQHAISGFHEHNMVYQFIAKSHNIANWPWCWLVIILVHLTFVNIDHAHRYARSNVNSDYWCVHIRHKSCWPVTYLPSI